MISLNKISSINFQYIKFIYFCKYHLKIEYQVSKKNHIIIKKYVYKKFEKIIKSIS